MCVRVSAVSHCPVGRVVDGLLVVRKIEVRYTTAPTVLKQLNSIPPSKHRPRANYCLMCTHVLYFGGVAAHRSKTQLLPFTACLFAHDASFVLVETVGWALPATRSPQPYPICQDGILKGGPRARVWTTGPYLSIWLIPLGKY